MAKARLFTAYDAGRRKKHHVAGGVHKITEHRIRREDWAVTKPKPSPPKGKKSAAKSTKSPRTTAAVLRCSPEFICLQCGNFGDDKTCGQHCLRAFRKEHFVHSIDIRSHPTFGYGAFTAPKTTIRKGDFVGEYIGELLPLHSRTDSGLYRFEIPSVCAIDSQRAGNWTRFINSSCDPNVKPWGDTVGRRHVILFQALRDIKPGEELLFNYGSYYFEKAGFMCGCGAVIGPHVPKGNGSKKKR